MNKKKKILLVSIVFLVCVAVTSHVFGAINEVYTTSTVDATWLNDITDENSLLKPIAYLLLWLAGVIEWLLAGLGNMVGGGSAVMPWADAILFNAVPLLDPNFINPADGSITSILNGVLGKIYFTVFYLSVSFFSISVLLMAIKLAVSSIASEKAKYKEAITNWIIGLVLLFSMHYLMSFCFYLNESLVKVACDIAMDSTEKLDLTVEADKSANTIIDDIEDLLTIDDTPAKYLKEHKDTLEKVCVSDAIRDIYNHKGMETFSTFEGIELDQIVSDKGNLYTIAALVAAVENYDSLSDPNGKLNDVINNKKYDSYTSKSALGGMIKISDLLPTNTSLLDFIKDDTLIFGNNRLYQVLKEAAGIAGFTLTSAQFDSAFTDGKVEYDGITDVLTGMCTRRYSSSEKKAAKLIKAASSGQTIDPNDLGETPITQLANYFKLTCYKYDGDSGGIKADEIDPVHVLLYVIFVVQSLLYFFAYVKRLFYIIILAMMAPIIVTYNFIMQI